MKKYKMEEPNKIFSFIAIVVTTLVLFGCVQDSSTNPISEPQSTVLEPTADNCAKLCIEQALSGGLDSQYMKDQCHSSCSQLEYYGGKKAIAAMIKSDQDETKFSKDMQAGVFDKDIDQCVVWKLAFDNITNILLNISNPPTISVPKVLDQKGAINTCKMMVHNWVINDAKTPALGTKFVNDTNRIENQLKLVYDCYPVNMEYRKTLQIKTYGIDDFNNNPYPKMHADSLQECWSRVERGDIDTFMAWLKAQILDLNSHEYPIQHRS